MNAQSIKRLQKIYGVTGIQELINTGSVWSLEGSMGRYAMDLLKTGICMLPTRSRIDYYHNIVPSRNHVKAGTTGSYHNCLDFWKRVDEGDIDAVETLELI